MRRWSATWVIGLVCVAALCRAAPTGDPESASREGSDGAPAGIPEVRGEARGSSGVADLRARLEGLRPDDPMAYFELGEEVAYEMPFLAGTELARHLYVLSFELDRRGEHPRGIGGSVCLALAELSTDVSEQRWLRALAEALEGGTGDVRWSVSLAVGGSDRGPLDLADAMARARAGDVRQLRTMLSRFDVATMLRDAGMKPEEARDFVGVLEREMARLRAHPPSREVRKTAEGELVVELEPTSGGNPGPSLSESEYLEQLRVEMMLLDGRPGTWAGQMLMGGDAPLRDIDPGELAPYFGVDAERPVFRAPVGTGWRDGVWVREGGDAGAREGERGVD